ncbi:hypothetical protein H0H81_000327 [Sphagnurus paluster]|uniref:FAD/NAD(P)-binding domain-containing protein n=1 Tax=Sphagnurus paluster TaxID=117069 RepID=A0A9P7GNK2_9AGAR|nr:hypothetical protein H0H81_000327 [Sphagnurus paluster]
MANKPVLPTLDRLKAKVSPSASAVNIAQAWLSAFSESNAQSNIDIAEDLFLPDSYWRDYLALTSEIRSLTGRTLIKQLINSRRSHLLSLRLLQELHNSPTIDAPFPDLTFVQFSFAFETPIGSGSGIGRLVPGADEKWRAFTIMTCLDSLRDHVEEVGVNRSATPIIEPWEAFRKNQVDLVDEQPQVIIIGKEMLYSPSSQKCAKKWILISGGGQAGLETAARLKHLDVPTLVVERNPRFPLRGQYIVPPGSLIPSSQLANFLESYAETLELSVWTSSEIQSAEWHQDTKEWSVTIRRRDSEIRSFSVKHLVFTPGFGGGLPNMPQIPNHNTFKGKVLHSSNFKTARDFLGKKAVVVGACNSGLFKEGANIEHADRVNASLTWPVIEMFHQRLTPHFAQTIDKDTIEGLNKVGFKTNLGPQGAGIFPLLYARSGGYYIDTGGSQEIIDGKIKLKTGSAIRSFTETGLDFEDGSKLDADVIVFATG